MDNDQQIDREKVVGEFNRRARVHGNMNAVLDAGLNPAVIKQNTLRDYLTRVNLVRLLRPAASDCLLDYGCGVGRLSGILAKRAKSIQGIDPSPEMIRTAISQNPAPDIITYMVLQGERLPYPDGAFDKVFTVWVLQHVGDQELESLAPEFYRVLKPRGRVVLIEQTRETREMLSDIHVHREAGAYSRLFTRNGFSLISDNPVMRIPSYAMWLNQKLPGNGRWMLPLLYLLEKWTLLYKVQHVDYYSRAFVFRKNNE